MDGRKMKNPAPKMLSHGHLPPANDLFPLEKTPQFQLRVRSLACSNPSGSSKILMDISESSIRMEVIKWEQQRDAGVTQP